MAIHTVWDDRERTMIRMEFETEWTVAELEAAVLAVDTLITSVTHQVDILIDIEGAKLPKNFLDIAKTLLANPEPRDNEGNRVVVGANALVRQGYALIKKTFARQLEGREMLFVDDLDTARAMLKGMR